jgi:hypothetical protein
MYYESLVIDWPVHGASIILTARGSNRGYGSGDALHIYSLE